MAGLKKRTVGYTRAGATHRATVSTALEGGKVGSRQARRLRQYEAGEISGPQLVERSIRAAKRLA